MEGPVSDSFSSSSLPLSPSSMTRPSTDRRNYYYCSSSSSSSSLHHPVSNSDSKTGTTTAAAAMGQEHYLLSRRKKASSSRRVVVVRPATDGSRNMFRVMSVASAASAVAVLLLMLVGDVVSAFQSSSPLRTKTSRSCPTGGRTSLFMAEESNTSSSQPKQHQHQDSEIERQLQKARAVLAISRAKIGATNTDDNDDVSRGNDDDDDDDDEIDMKTLQQRQRKGALASNVPFFATTTPIDGSKKKKEKVIKNQNENDGTFTTDGDLMAKLSEQEEWESRSLLEVFRNERKATATDDALSDRDVAASIYGLRKSLQLEDFQKIFDKRNRFIGEQ